jgi:hypothetical protein
MRDHRRMGLLSKLRGSQPQVGSERDQIETSIVVLAYQPTLWQEIRSSPRYELRTRIDRSATNQLTVIARVGNLFQFFEEKAELADENARWLAIGVRDLVAIHDGGRDLSGHLQSIASSVVGPEKAVAQVVLKIVDPGCENQFVFDPARARARLAHVQ